MATTMFKSLSTEGWVAFQRHHRPGFLGNRYLAEVYSEPELTGYDQYLIAVTVDADQCIDRTEELGDASISDLCALGLRDGCFLCTGSGHDGVQVVYWGQPVTEWELLAHFTTDEEWESYWSK